MQLTLTDEESQALHDLLLAHLPQLEMEVARTDERDLRRVLLERQEVAKRLLGELGRRKP